MIARKVLYQCRLRGGGTVVHITRNATTAAQMDTHEIRAAVTVHLHPERIRLDRVLSATAPFIDARVDPATLALFQNRPRTVAKIRDAPHGVGLGLVGVRPAEGDIVHQLGTRPVHLPTETVLRARSA